MRSGENVISFFFLNRKMFLLFSLLFSFASAQECKISRYSVVANFDESRGKYSAEASLWIHVSADSLDAVTIVFPPHVNFTAAYDTVNAEYSAEEKTPSSEIDFHEIEISLPRVIQRSDSFFVQLKFNGEFDTSTLSPSYINNRSIYLRQFPDSGWLPFLSPQHSTNSTLATVRLEIHFSTSKTFISSSLCDSLSDSTKTHYIALSDSPVSIENAFSFIALQNGIQRTRFADDSTFSVTFSYENTFLNMLFADSLQKFLLDAGKYFSTLMQKNISSFHVIVLNRSPFSAAEFCGTALVFPTSPAYTVFDSLAFQLSSHNPWMLELAKRYSPASVDSLPWLNTAFAGYLTTKYFLFHTSSSADKQQRERYELIRNTLNFFPAVSLRENSMKNAYERDRALFKGRYVFLMLEYILGKQLMDSLILNIASRNTLTLSNLQTISETYYGTSLSWFFQDWINGSGIPEFVFSYETQQTPRGLYETKISVLQRGKIFSLPIPFRFTFGSRIQYKRVFLNQARQTLAFVFPTPPTSLELDPQLNILHWLVDLRIYAHAQTSVLFRIYRQNLESAEREARLALELDPNNATRTNSLAYFSLAKIFMLRNAVDTAQEYFHKSINEHSSEEAQLYSLLSLVRYGNTLEMQSKRTEALLLYKQALDGAKRNPVQYAPVIILAEKYLQEEFHSSEEEWYARY